MGNRYGEGAFGLPRIATLFNRVGRPNLDIDNESDSEDMIDTSNLLSTEDPLPRPEDIPQFSDYHNNNYFNAPRSPSPYSGSDDSEMELNENAQSPDAHVFSEDIDTDILSAQKIHQDPNTSSSLLRAEIEPELTSPRKPQLEPDDGRNIYSDCKRHLQDLQEYEDTLSADHENPLTGKMCRDNSWHANCVYDPRRLTFYHQPEKNVQETQLCFDPSMTKPNNSPGSTRLYLLGTNTVHEPPKQIDQCKGTFDLPSVSTLFNRVGRLNYNTEEGSEEKIDISNLLSTEDPLPRPEDIPRFSPYRDFDTPSPHSDNEDNETDLFDYVHKTQAHRFNEEIDVDKLLTQPVVYGQITNLLLKLSMVKFNNNLGSSRLANHGAHIVDGSPKQSDRCDDQQVPSLYRNLNRLATQQRLEKLSSTNDDNNIKYPETDHLKAHSSGKIMKYEDMKSYSANGIPGDLPPQHNKHKMDDRFIHEFKMYLKQLPKGSTKRPPFGEQHPDYIKGKPVKEKRRKPCSADETSSLNNRKTRVRFPQKRIPKWPTSSHNKDKLRRKSRVVPEELISYANSTFHMQDLKSRHNLADFNSHRPSNVHHSKASSQKRNPSTLSLAAERVQNTDANKPSNESHFSNKRAKAVHPPPHTHTNNYLSESTSTHANQSISSAPFTACNSDNTDHNHVSAPVTAASTHSDSEPEAPREPTTTRVNQSIPSSRYFVFHSDRAHQDPTPALNSATAAATHSSSGPQALESTHSPTNIAPNPRRVPLSFAANVFSKGPTYADHPYNKSTLANVQSTPDEGSQVSINKGENATYFHNFDKQYKETTLFTSEQKEYNTSTSYERSELNDPFVTGSTGEIVRVIYASSSDSEIDIE